MGFTTRITHAAATAPAPWVTIFPNYKAFRFERRGLMTPEAIVNMLETTKPAASKADAPFIKLAEFGDKLSPKNCLRFNDNVIAVYGIEGDYDGEKMSLDAAAKKLNRAGISAILYTSASHTPEAPHWRVLAFLSKPIKGGTEHLDAERKKYVGIVNAVLGGVLAPESFALSTSYYFGPIKGKPRPQVLRVDGACIDQIKGLPEPIYAKGKKVNETEYPQKTPDELLSKDRARTRGQIKFLKNNDAPYQTDPESDQSWGWFEMLCAIKGAFGDKKGWPIAEAWSAQSAKDNVDRDTKKVWDSIKPPRIGAEAIEAWAIAAGWKQPNDAKARVTAIRKSKSPARQKKHDISAVINRDLVEHGRFLRTPQKELLYFDDVQHRLISLDDSNDADLRYYINDSYGVNGSEAEYSYLYEDLGTAAHTRGLRVETHLFSHFDSATQKLYIAASESEVLRVTVAGVERVPNGTDAVYLRIPPQMADIPKVTPSSDRGAFDYIRRIPKLAETEKATRKQLRLLFEMFMWAVVFGAAALPTRPILLFHGEKGSRKTAAGHGFIISLFGADAKPTLLEKDKSDAIDALLTRQHLAVLDNVDGHYPGIENKLATAATGGEITRRKLYTTNEETRFLARSFLIATTREPKSFTRDDVVDRLLHLPCVRSPPFLTWKKVEDRIRAQRADWWAYVLHMLPKLIASLQRRHPEASEIRMQDFASFAIGIAKPLGYTHAEVIAALKASEAEKVTFVAEQSPLPEALAIIANHKHRTLSDTKVSATELLDELRRFVPSFQIKRANELGMRIQNELEAIQQRVQLTATKSKVTKAWQYCLGRKVAA